MTLQDEIAKLEKATEAKRRELETEYKVRGELGKVTGIEEYSDPKVYPYPLYGRRGSVHFEWNKYRLSTEKGKDPDANLLRHLLATFPPVAQVKVKDGCTSFRPDVSAPGFNRKYARGFSQLPEGAEQWPGEITPVCPVTVRVEVFQGPDVAFEWVALLAGELWTFHVKVPLHKTNVGRLDVRYNRYAGGHGDISSVERCEFYPEYGGRVIKWGSGDRKTPNSFTVYWTPEAGEKIVFPELIKPEPKPEVKP